jgi:[ribosomal protein S18]-alanine N-acetyltransferase
MVEVRPLAGEDVPPLARLVAGTPLWQRYGYLEERCAADLGAALAEGQDALFAAGPPGAPRGLAWVLRRGAFGRAPYLKLLAVAEGDRGQGVGAALLAAAEAVGPELVLLVSDFNDGARAFYGRQGYIQVGALADFVLPGVTELILRKVATARRRP